MQKKMESVKEKLKCTTIFISIAWQQMYEANPVLTIFANITMTMPKLVLFIHVLVERIFNTSIYGYNMYNFETLCNVLQL